MAGKLIYYYGTVNSSKTMLLLSIGFNYDSCNWKVCCVKPALDTRSELIETRAKVPPRKVDIAIKENEYFSDYNDLINNADVILIDECQFLTPEQIDELRSLTTNRDIDVLCFGLRTDFNTHLFPASKRLFELADEIIEVKTICSICGKHAGFNVKVDKTNCDGSIELGWNNFEQRCWKCYHK